VGRNSCRGTRVLRHSIA